MLAWKLSYHMAGTTPGPSGGHQGNWGDERGPTSQTPAAASLLLWRWSPVLRGGKFGKCQNILESNISLQRMSPCLLHTTGNGFQGPGFDREDTIRIYIYINKKTDLQHLDVKGLVWTGSSVSWISWKYNIQSLMANREILPSSTLTHNILQPGQKKLPLRAIINVAPRVLRVCGCTTRKAACRLYVKGTQARSPKTSMNPKPSCTMSMVVRTASCFKTMVHKIKWKVGGWTPLRKSIININRTKMRIHGRHLDLQWSAECVSLLYPHLIPQGVCHIQQLETVDEDHGEWGGASKLHLFHQHAKVYDHLRGNHSLGGTLHLRFPNVRGGICYRIEWTITYGRRKYEKHKPMKQPTNKTSLYSFLQFGFCTDYWLGLSC